MSTIAHACWVVEDEEWRVHAATGTGVSSFGRIVPKTGDPFPVWQIRNTGVLYVTLDEIRWPVARLVLEAFGRPLPAPSARIRYHDGDKNNLAITNLAWDRGHYRLIRRVAKMKRGLVVSTYASLHTAARAAHMSAAAMRRACNEGVLWRQLSPNFNRPVTAQDASCGGNAGVYTKPHYFNSIEAACKAMRLSFRTIEVACESRTEAGGYTWKWARRQAL